MPGLSRLRVVRIAVVALVALIAAATLSACRTNVGNAATVDGARISESDVTQYLNGKGAAPALVRQYKTAGQELPSARGTVLQYLLDERIYERTLRRNGGVPSASALTGAKETAVTVLLGGGQPVSDSQLRGQLVNLGVRAAYLPRLLRATELKYAVIERLQLQRLPQLAAAVDKAGAGSVQVSPRYGTWSADTLLLSSSGKAGLPGYLTLQTAAPAAPAGAADAP